MGNNRATFSSSVVAAITGCDKVIEELIKAPGILVNKKYRDNCTPLHQAIKNRHDEIVEQLLKAPGILVNEKGCDNCTPLHLAVRCSRDKIVDKLLKVPGILVNEKYCGIMPTFRKHVPTLIL